MNDAARSLNLAAILEEAPQSATTRRVYANQNLDMSKIEVVGFDMDYTLVVGNTAHFSI